MLCVWWDHCSIIPFEFLNCNQTLNANLNSQQLQHSHENLLRKCPTLVNRRNVAFLYDNAKPPSARITQEKILDLTWSIPLHPPYSPDLTPNDFHRFFLYKMFWMTKNFLKKIMWKCLWKTSSAGSRLNFPREESSSNLINGKTRLKKTANVLLIEMNSL